MRETLDVVTSTPAGLAVVVVWAAFMGAAFASFLCVVVERVPRGESVMGRSHCVCGRQLSGIENIPVVSWLALRGRSRCCKQPIPVFYMTAEAALAVCWGAAVALLGISWSFVLVSLASCAALTVVGAVRGRR